MSDLLIRGMEMPKDIEPGLVIEFADGIDGKRYARLYHYQHGGLTEWLEAAPVPEHGRLGDLDALAAQCDDPYWCVWLSDIEAAPTIVPACEEVYAKHTDTAGNLHWAGTSSGAHTIPASNV